MELLSQQELRISIVVPERDIIVSPSHGRASLFTGVREEGETYEDAAHRIVADERYGLPRMKTRIALGRVCDKVGLALQPSDPDSLNLRQFTVFRFDQQTLLRLIETRPDYTNEIDQEFLRRAILHRPRV